MHVGVVGINHKLADLKLRELLAKCCVHRFGPTTTVHGLHSFVLLSTCNRTEIYFSSDDLTQTHTYLLQTLRHDVKLEFEHKLYTYFGIDCFKHLCRVTAGLDSAILAETEIQGQVKGAYESCSHYHRLPKDLHYMFQKALKIGKQVRSELALGRGLPDLEHAIHATGTQFFNSPEKQQLLFVGASNINLKIISFLKSKGYSKITLCNRTAEKARQASFKLCLNILEWHDLPLWTSYDWVIFGTKSSQCLISKESLIHSQHINTKLLVDLSVPRNIDPNIIRTTELNLLNIDQLNRSLKWRKQKAACLITQAEDLIDTASIQYARAFRAKEQRILHFLAG